MGKDELRQHELEKELEALYKKVASLDTLGKSKRQEKESEEPIKTDEELDFQQQSGESPFQSEKKRILRIFGVVPTLVLLALSFVVVAILVWPKIYRYDSINSGGKTYVLRVNSVTGQTMYFDGKEWLKSPIPADSVKKLAESPKDQPAQQNTINWNFAIQVKAYPEASGSEAVAFMEYLRKGQPDVHMEKVHLPGRGIWYRIFLGYFMTADEASDYMKKKRIADAYPGSYVQSRSQ
jgi:hypothetical protein